MPRLAAITLAAAGLLTAGLVIPVFLLPPAQGYNGIGQLLLMAAAAILRWFLLAVLLFWCIWTGRLEWLGGVGTAGRLAVGLGAHVALGVLSGTAMVAAADQSMLRGLPDGFYRLVHAAAQLGCTLPAVAVIGCLVVALRPGPAKIPAVPLLGMAAGALAGLAVVAAMVGRDMRDQRAQATEAAERELAHATGLREQLAALTDADSLVRWDEFVHWDEVSGVGAEALRRLSVRPSLERDLIEALGCDCRNPNWTSELLWLVGAIPFAPGPELAEPARQAMDALTDNLGAAAAGAYREQRDTYVDLYLARDLDTVRAVALKLARTAKADLRPALQNMRRAVIETYPRSEAARRYPAEVDRTLGEIAAALGAP